MSTALGTERSAERVVDAGSYRVHIAAGLRHSFASLIAQCVPAHRFAIISDDNVAPLYGSALRDALHAIAPASVHVMRAGEQHKTRDTWARLTDELLDAGCGRDTAVVALGGGVVGDVAGFVAATYMRGVPVVQCPTSLLAMIDASVGGKTGVDTPAGKNLVGAFHPPSLVMADVDVLSSLPVEHRRAGLAEAIKHGVVADADHFAELEASIDALLAGDADALRSAVARSVEIKSSVVREDPEERGRRKILNFGHTIGHAVEQESGYALLHGECVALGMVYEARLAERMGIATPGIAERIADVAARCGLPTRMPPSISPDAVLVRTRRDKKARRSAVEYALPESIGTMYGGVSGWSVPVDDALVAEVLR